MHQELIWNRNYTSALKQNLPFLLFFCCGRWDSEPCHVIQGVSAVPEEPALTDRSSWGSSGPSRNITRVILGRQRQPLTKQQHCHPRFRDMLRKLFLVSVFFSPSTRLILGLGRFHTTAEPEAWFLLSASDPKDGTWFEINITDFGYQLAGVYLCAACPWWVEPMALVPERAFSVPLEMLQAVLAGLQLLLQKSTNFL